MYQDENDFNPNPICTHTYRPDYPLLHVVCVYCIKFWFSDKVGSSAAVPCPSIAERSLGLFSITSIPVSTVLLSFSFSYISTRD